MRDSASIKRLLIRIGCQWRWVRQRGRVWNKFLHRSHRRCLELRHAHTHTQVEEQVQGCRRCFTMEVNMLLDMEWLSWKNYKRKTDTNTSDRQPWQNRAQTQSSNLSMRRQETWNKLRYSGGKLQQPLASCSAALQLTWGQLLPIPRVSTRQTPPYQEPIWQPQAARAIHWAPSITNTNCHSLKRMQKLPCDSGLRKTPSSPLPFPICCNISSFSLHEKVTLLQKVCGLPTGWAVLNKQLQGKIFAEMWMKHLRLTALFSNCPPQAMPPN